MSSEGRGEYLLYDSGTGTITFVEPNQQQYTQLTAAELEAMVKTAANVRQSMAPYMASMLAGSAGRTAQNDRAAHGGDSGCTCCGQAREACRHQDR